jgi:hypothetical protein
MSLEDRTAAKLKGMNCLIKFLDGEEVCTHIADLDDDDFEAECLYEIEKFLNDKECIVCSIGGIALSKAHVKYIRRL